MVGTQIVNTTDEEHARFRCFGLASQMPSPARQTGQALADSGIDALDKCGVDDTPLLAVHQAPFHLRGVALCDPTRNRQAIRTAAFDDLHNVDIRPSDQTTPFFC